MAQPEAYDTLVLGSGEGGKCIAWHLAAQGKRAAMIERRYVGGSCPNIACLPAATILPPADRCRSACSRTPELARIGLSERDAKTQGIAYRLGKLPMRMVLRARTLSEERGFMKALLAAHERN